MFSWWEPTGHRPTSSPLAQPLHYLLPTQHYPEKPDAKGAMQVYGLCCCCFKTKDGRQCRHRPVGPNLQQLHRSIGRVWQKQPNLEEAQKYLEQAYTYVELASTAEGLAQSSELFFSPQAGVRAWENMLCPGSFGGCGVLLKYREGHGDKALQTVGEFTFSVARTTFLGRIQPSVPFTEEDAATAA